MSDQEWKITDKQKVMIIDRIACLSKKEASLLIKLIQALYDNRTPPELRKAGEL